MRFDTPKAGVLVAQIPEAGDQQPLVGRGVGLEALVVGMPFQDAAVALDSAGAREVRMDMIDQTETEVIRPYGLGDGRVLVVSVSKSEDKVTRLEICENLDQTKVWRTWASIESFRLSKD